MMDTIQLLNEAPLKAVFLGHFMLITWALVGEWLPQAYLFYNAFFLMTLLWSMHSRDSHDPILMATLINLLSIVMDAITIGVHYGGAKDDGQRVAFGFSVFMAIINLLLRPITSLALYRVYNERNGRYSTFGFPGLGGLNPSGGANFGAVGGSGGGGGGGGGGRGSYENIDNAVPHQSVPSPIRGDIDSNNTPLYK